MTLALVTGGAGLIGSHIVDKLLIEGYKVRILDNLEKETHPNGSPNWIPHQVEFIQGDVSNIDVVKKAIKDVQIIFHQAAYGGFVPELEKYVFSNVVGTTNLYTAIQKENQKIEKIVVASSQAIYGEGKYDCPNHGEIHPPFRNIDQLKVGKWEIQCHMCQSNLKPLPTDEDISPDTQTIYSATKLSEERIALTAGKAIGVPTVALRYSVTYGPRQSIHNPYTGICSIFSTRIVNGLPPIIYEDGNQTRDFIFVEDVAEANLLCLKNESANFQIFNVGTGIPTSVCEFAKLLNQKLGKTGEILIEGKFRPGDVRHLFADTSKIQKLGFRPKIKLEMGFERYVTWLEKQGSIKEYFSKAEQILEEKGIVLRSGSLH